MSIEDPKQEEVVKVDERIKYTDGETRAISISGSLGEEEYNQLIRNLREKKIESFSVAIQEILNSLPDYIREELLRESEQKTQDFFNKNREYYINIGKTTHKNVPEEELIQKTAMEAARMDAMVFQVCPELQAIYRSVVKRPTLAR